MKLMVMIFFYPFIQGDETTQSWDYNQVSVSCSLSVVCCWFLGELSPQTTTPLFLFCDNNVFSYSGGLCAFFSPPLPPLFMWWLFLVVAGMRGDDCESNGDDGGGDDGADGDADEGEECDVEVGMAIHCGNKLVLSVAEGAWWWFVNFIPLLSLALAASSISMATAAAAARSAARSAATWELGWLLSIVSTLWRLSVSRLRCWWLWSPRCSSNSSVEVGESRSMCLVAAAAEEKEEEECGCAGGTLTVRTLWFKWEVGGRIMTLLSMAL